MKKFDFRLEKIRRYKEQLEQDKKMKLAAEQNRWLAEKNILEQIEERRNRYFLNYGTRKPGKLNIVQLMIAKRYLDKLAKDIAIQTKKVAAARKDMDKAQHELVEASKEKKKYEKLREKHLLLYKKDFAREEHKELDEFGSRSMKYQIAGR